MKKSRDNEEKIVQILRETERETIETSWCIGRLYLRVGVEKIEGQVFI